MKRNFLYRANALFICLVLATAVAACSGQDNQPEVVEESTEAPAKVVEVDEVSPTSDPVAVAATQEPQKPESTATLAPMPTETALPTPTVVPVSINGMPSDQFIIMSDKSRSHVREIYAKGESMGRDPNIFSILGDSLIATPQSLAKWDGDDYILGEYDFLQPTVDQYAGSFSRYGATVRVGLHSWSVFDPLWADKEICLANEDVLTCEIRLNNPSVMIIFLGSNDAGSPGGFNVNYRQLVESLIDQGIVPILATKADRFEGGDNVNNEIIRKAADAYEVPLLEFDILADTLPGRGLGPDNVHLTFLEPLDYSSSEIFAVGYPVHNLASLMILDEVRQETSRDDED